MELTLVLTHACNLACTYCYAGDKHGRVMDESLAQRAIDFAVSHYAGNRPMQVGYFGGEPLMAWDLLQRCHAYAANTTTAKGIPLRGTITTNGTLLDGAKMAWCKEQNIVVAISIDGDREAQDRGRLYADGRSTFDATLAGLRVALAQEELTQTVSVVSPPNVDHMATSVDYLLDAGVRVLSLGLDYTAEWNAEALDTLEHQLNTVGDRYVDNFSRNEDIYISVLDAKIIAHLKGGLEDCDKCQAGHRELALAPSGNWYPCERLVGNDGQAEAKYCLGNANNTADGGPDPRRVFAALQGHGTLDPTCAACVHRSRCMNHCACSNAMSGGELAVPGSSVCETEQVCIRVADRVAKTLFDAGNALFLRKHYGIAPADFAKPRVVI